MRIVLALALAASFALPGRSAAQTLEQADEALHQRLAAANARNGQPRALSAEEFLAVARSLYSLIPAGESSVAIMGRLDAEDFEPCEVKIEESADGGILLFSELSGSYLSGFFLHPGAGPGELPDLFLRAEARGGDVEIVKPLYQSDSRTRLAIAGGRLRSYALSYPSKDADPGGEEGPEIVCKF